MQIGQPFNPFRLFTGIFIPEGLVRANGISAGAKLAYGRLLRYAGQDGECYSAVPTLASEIGVSVRQTQNYLRELERCKLIRRLARLFNSGQTSNAYVFLWHSLLQDGMKKTAPEGVHDTAPGPVKDCAPKESHSEESHFEESHGGDLDYPATNRKSRDSRPDLGLVSDEKPKYPRLRQVMADYLRLPDDDQRVVPTERQVVDVIDAALGASEDEVIHCLRYLYNERRLRPRTKHGPRHFSWFKTVVADYFRQRWDRSNPAVPACTSAETPGGLSKAEFDFMTDVIELEGP